MQRVALGVSLVVCKFKEPHPAAAPSSVLCCRAQELPEAAARAELGDPWVRPRSRCPAVHRPQRPFHPEVCWSSTDSVGQILVAPVVTSDGYPDKLSEQCEAKGCSSVLSIKPCQAPRRKKKVLKITHPKKIRHNSDGHSEGSKEQERRILLCHFSQAWS